jgi:hypothetical protein
VNQLQTNFYDSKVYALEATRFLKIWNLKTKSSVIFCVRIPHSEFWRMLSRDLRTCSAKSIIKAYLSVISNSGDFTDCKSETLFIKCTTTKKRMPLNY